MLPHARQTMPRMWIFQHDNDPKHTATLVKDWLRTKKLKVMAWPAQSRYLNPIEIMWNEVDRQIRHTTYKNLDELWAAVQVAWGQVQQPTN